MSIINTVTKFRRAAVYSTKDTTEDGELILLPQHYNARIIVKLETSLGKSG